MGTPTVQLPTLLTTCPYLAGLHQTSKMETLKTAAHNHMPPLRAPPSPKHILSLYSTFITKNQSSVTQIESALRSLTYIIPGRFRDAELASESLHSSIQLLSLYHDALLARAVGAKSPGSGSPRPQQQSGHNRYTKFWVGHSRFYRRVATAPAVVQYTQLLWEMMAKRKGERVRWRVVVILEVIKAVCRLCLLRMKRTGLSLPSLPNPSDISSYLLS